MDYIKAKSILSSWSSGNNWFGCNYNMNIYKGCSHGCIYCDSRSECYQVENFDKVRAKENVFMLLDEELKKRKKGIVGTGAMSDPYNPQERKHEITREALKLIHKYQHGIGLLTKSDLVARDIDVLTDIKKHSPSMVNFTITTFDDDLCSKIEPNVSSTSERFKALKACSDAGIFTGVLIWPILPFINDTGENIKNIIETAASHGANFVIPFYGVTLRNNQRDYFYNKLDQHFPGLKEHYIKTYGNQYVCTSPNKNQMKKVVENLCQKYNLPYMMPDIIKALKEDGERQLTLF